MKNKKTKIDNLNYAGYFLPDSHDTNNPDRWVQYWSVRTKVKLPINLNPIIESIEIKITKEILKLFKNDIKSDILKINLPKLKANRLDDYHLVLIVERASPKKMASTIPMIVTWKPILEIDNYFQILDLQGLPRSAWTNRFQMYFGRS